MPVKLHYNFKDVPRAARFGFSAKKMWVQFLGLLVGTILYSIFAYIGFLLSGYTISEVWRIYHYVPIPLGEGITLLGKIFIGIGLFLFIVVNLFAGVAVSKITYEQLRGDEFYEVKKALSFAIKEGKAVVLAPLTLLLIGFLIIVAGFVLGLLGKIPWFGELILLLLSVPAFFAVLFIVYLFFSFILSLFLSAGVVATTRADTFDTLFEIFSTLNEQNWRVVSYEALLYGTKILATGIFAWAVGRALWIAHVVLSAPWLMGAKYASIEKAALSYFTTSPYLFNFYDVFRFLGINALLDVPGSAVSLSLPSAVLGFIFGIFLYFIVFMVISYWCTMHWVGNTIIFTIIAKKKDEIDLLKKKEEEFFEGPKVEEKEEAKEETK